MEIEVILSEPSTTKATGVERVTIDGAEVKMDEAHISSRHICLHLDHPTVKKISFKQ